MQDKKKTAYIAENRAVRISENSMCGEDGMPLPNTMPCSRSEFVTAEVSTLNPNDKTIETVFCQRGEYTGLEHFDSQKRSDMHGAFMQKVSSLIAEGDLAVAAMLSDMTAKKKACMEQLEASAHTWAGAEARRQIAKTAMRLIDSEKVNPSFLQGNSEWNTVTQEPGNLSPFWFMKHECVNNAVYASICAKEVSNDAFEVVGTVYKNSPNANIQCSKLAISKRRCADKETAIKLASRLKNLFSKAYFLTENQLRQAQGQKLIIPAECAGDFSLDGVLCPLYTVQNATTQEPEDREEYPCGRKVTVSLREQSRVVSSAEGNFSYAGGIHVFAAVESVASKPAMKKIHAGFARRVEELLECGLSTIQEELVDRTRAVDKAADSIIELAKAWAEMEAKYQVAETAHRLMSSVKRADGVDACGQWTFETGPATAANRYTKTVYTIANDALIGRVYARQMPSGNYYAGCSVETRCGNPTLYGARGGAVISLGLPTKDKLFRNEAKMLSYMSELRDRIYVDFGFKRNHEEHRTSGEDKLLIPAPIAKFFSIDGILIPQYEIFN